MSHQQSEFSQFVSKMIDQYEEEQAREVITLEAQEQRALVQGVTVGSLLRVVGSIGMKEVEIVNDLAGNYEPYFYVTMETGHRVKVSFEVD